MPAPGRIRITKNSQWTTTLLDYRGAANNFIAWDGQFQITEFENDVYLEFDFEENEDLCEKLLELLENEDEEGIMDIIGNLDY